MKIQINTDAHSVGTQARAAHLNAEVKQALAQWNSKITRVEIHLSDENGSKNGQLDQRCMLEARIEGRQPVAVSDHAATMEQAVQGATQKLVRMMSGILGRLHEHRQESSGRTSSDTRQEEVPETDSGIRLPDK